MRDSFVFYRSFYEAIKELPEKNQLEILLALADYSLNFEAPELDGISKVVFTLIKPQIDANIRKFENGKKGAEHGIKGGRPKTPKKPLNNPKKTPKKPQENPTKTPNVNVNDNVNVNVNENNNEKDNVYRKFAHLKISVSDFNKLKLDYTELQINKILDQIENYRKNTNYKSLYLTARNWLEREYPDKPAGEVKKQYRSVMGTVEFTDNEFAKLDPTYKKGLHLLTPKNNHGTNYKY